MVERALKDGDLSALKSMVDDGTIDINGKLPNGLSYLTQAVIDKHYGIVDYLIDSGADVNQPGGSLNVTALIEACRYNDLKAVKLLIDSGRIDGSIRNIRGNTALIFATYHKNPELLTLVFNTCVECVNFQNTTTNDTPLHYAVHYSNSVALQLFVDNPETDVNIQNIDGKTALHLAFDRRQYELVNILLKSKTIDFSKRDNNGDTVVMSAAKVYYSEAIEQILGRAPELVNIPSKTGETPLHAASRGDPYYSDTVKVLLHYGANPNAKDENGLTPVRYTNSPEVYRLLIDAMRGPPQPYKGYSKSDAELFNQMFEEPNEWSFCPVCLAYVRRSDGCMYMKHYCEVSARHEELYEKFKDQLRNIEWCTICGRISQNHKHYKLSKADAATKPGFAPISPLAPEGIERHFDSDCTRVGGGGFEEKVRRTHRLLGYACVLQSEVGKLNHDEARKKLVEEVWNAASGRNLEVPKLLETKKFDFPCRFPEDANPAPSTEKEYPDIPRPADEEELTPIEHDAPDNDCAVELGPHDDGRPVYQFIHKQPDGSIYEHEAYICASDLEALIKSQTIDGKCRIEPDKCKALLYPEELYDIATPEFYETYQKLFNKANAKEGGRRKNKTKKRFRFRGGQKVPSLMKPLDIDTAECAPPQKAGKRRTFKKKIRKSHTRRRRV
jgi:ankyrin repeat protein